MKETITLYGKIGFEPDNRTKKHDSQSSWKRMALVNLEDEHSYEITSYYSWFIRKRYNLVLNKPIRGGHISFINDSIRDLSLNNTKTIEEIDETWDSVKTKWDGKTIPITLDLTPKTDDKHWWLTVSHEERELLHGIRAELGLGRPYWGLHMTIGYANEKFIEHSQYIHRLVKTGLIK